MAQSADETALLDLRGYVSELIDQRRGGVDQYLATARQSPQSGDHYRHLATEEHHQMVRAVNWRDAIDAVLNEIGSKKEEGP